MANLFSDDPAVLGIVGSLQQTCIQLFPAAADLAVSGRWSHWICASCTVHRAVSDSAGFINFVGFLAFFAAVQKGKVSTVISLSSLYPVITIGLSILLLHEKITRREGLGIAFALAAGWLLAG
jgi:uncharacterized membrane protein